MAPSNLPALDPTAPIHALVAAQVRRTPDGVAVLHGDTELSYAELDARSAALAARLRAAGAGQDAPVAVCLPRSAELVVALLAVLRAGAGYLPLDPAYPAERIELIMDDARAPLVVTDRGHEALLAGSGAVAVHVGTEAPTGQPAAEAPTGQPAEDADVTLDDRAYVIYTSGSTGRPKGVDLAHRGVNALLRWAAATYRPDELTGVLFATSVCFDISVFEVFFPLVVGGTVVVAENALALPDLPARERVTLVNTVPSAMAALLRGPGLPAGVRVVNLAGEPLPRRLADQVYAQPQVRRLFNLYGPTEDTVYSTWSLVGCDDTAEPTIGVPLPGTTGHVLDEQRRSVPDGGVGELYLAGEGLARGYLGQPELTAERFVLVSDDRCQSTHYHSRAYRTGDLVRRLPDGQLEYHGRTDHQVKVRGFRVELGEIESVLARFPGVQLAAAVARDDDAGRYLAGFVQAVADTVTTAALREHCARLLPGYMVPSALKVLPSLPLTPNGKVDRRALPPIERQRDEQRAFVAPRDELEAAVAALWREVLGIAEIGVHDVFLDLGGHSLLAAAVLSRVEREFGVRVGIGEFFCAPTVAALAARVRASAPAAAPTVRPVRAPAAAPAVSAIQREFWVGERMYGDGSEPSNTLFNVPIRVRATGRLDLDRLAAALSTVVARHEVLRTGLSTVDGEPVAVVREPYPVAVAVADLSEQPAELDAVLREEASLPIDLAGGQLLRALAVRLAGDHHELLITVHHAAVDGWSIGVLLDELGAAYAGRELPEPALQFGDVARWEERSLAAGRQRLLDYWTRQLAGADQQQDLPGDRSAPAHAGMAGDRLDRTVDPELLARAERWAAAEGASLYVLLLAVLGALIHRYTGRRDQVVTTPFALRPHPELERVIGPLLTTLGIRFDVGADVSLRELVHRIRPVVLDAIEHSALPFADLVAAAGAPRDPDSTPVSQVMLAVQNHPLPSVRLPELRLDFVAEVSAGVSRTPLSLFLEFPPAGPLLTAEYRTARYDAGTVSALMDHLLALLAAGLAEPDRPVGELPMLSDAELAALVLDCNRTTAPYPDRCLHELVALSALRFSELGFPERVAVSCAERSLTYAELDAQANRLAQHLIARGAQPGVRVGVALRRGSRMLVALLAVLKAGAAYLPVDPEHPVARTRFVFDDAAVRLVITESACVDGLTGLDRLGGLDGLDGGLVDLALVDLDRDAAVIAAAPATEPGVRIEPDATAYVLYTSGSTGRPKGVAVPHRALVNFLTSMAARPGLRADDVVAAITTLTFDIAGLELWLPLLVGARVAVADRATAADGMALRRWLDAERVTLLQATPATWRMLLAAGWTGRPGLTALCGGEALTRDLARELLDRTARLWNVYGPTETTIWSTIQPVGAAAAAGDGVVALGEPIANTRVYVLDQRGAAVPPNVIGELCIAGDGLADGYLGRPELTGQRFVQDPFGPLHGGVTGQLMYRTGDLARRRRDGTLEYCGRTDHQVKLRGYRIELGEIEAVLAAQPGVAAAAVALRPTGMGDGAAGPRLIGYLVPAGDVPKRPTHAHEPANTPTIRELVGGLRSQLPDYMVPAAFVTLAELPLTPNGKVDRAALADPDLADLEPAAGGVEFEPPDGDCEEILAELWLDVLGVQRVGRHDDFFALGGHSLQATRMLARVRDQFEIELPVRAIFDEPTLAGLAARIEQTLLAELELVGEN